MTDLVIAAILVAVLALAAWYVIKAKKSGRKCIGCPSGGNCGKCTCHCGEEK